MSDGTPAVPPVPIQKDDGTWDLSGVPEESRPFFETIIKGHDDAHERAEKAEEVAKGEREQRLAREYIAKAEGYSHIAKADELGPVLKEIAGAISEESFEILTKALETAEERVAMGVRLAEGDRIAHGIFKEYGREGHSEGGSEDPMEKLEKMADELVEKDGDLTPEQAFTQVLKTAAGRELYAAYLAERPALTSSNPNGFSGREG